MYAEIHVTDTGGTASVVEVQLKEGGVSSTNYIEVEAPDSLLATIQGDPDTIHLSGDLFSNINQLSNQYKVMNRGMAVAFYFFSNSLLGASGIWYITSFQNVPAGTEFTVSLLRRIDDGAPASTVILPDAFDITQPVAGTGALFSRGLDDIIVNWAPSGTTDTMVLSAAIVCENSDNDTWTQTLANDPGTYTISANTFTGLTGNCTASINVQRSHSGQLDPAYGKGGIVVGHQSRNVVINTVD